MWGQFCTLTPLPLLEQLNIPLERNNEDEGRTNPYGMKLLDWCRRCSREKHVKVDCDRKYVKWNQAKSQQFVNDLFSDENGGLKNLDEKHNVIVSNNDDDCIDDIVSDLQKIFVNTAKSFISTPLLISPDLHDWLSLYFWDIPINTTIDLTWSTRWTGFVLLRHSYQHHYWSDLI